MAISRNRTLVGILAVVVAIAVLLTVRALKKPVVVQLAPNALPLELSWSQAEAYLTAHEYPVAHTLGSCAPKCTSYRVEANQLKGTKPAEEELIFEFRTPGDASPPTCVTYYPGLHGDPWEKGVERLLGTPMTPTGPLGATHPACHAVDAEHLACHFVTAARSGRQVPVEIQVQPNTKRVVWGVRLGPCAVRGDQPAEPRP
ncbi:MAG: hypothetical protein U0263_04515 [Polyangiaceae bacterium]